MGKPATLFLDIYQDDDFSQALQFKDETGTAIDITSWTLKAEIRDKPGGSTLVETFTITTVSAANGQVTLDLSDVETLALTPGTYSWDLQRTLSGLKTTLLAGEVRVRADVTR